MPTKRGRSVSDTLSPLSSDGINQSHLQSSEHPSSPSSIDAAPNPGPSDRVTSPPAPGESVTAAAPTQPSQPPQPDTSPNPPLSTRAPRPPPSYWGMPPVPQNPTTDEERTLPNITHLAHGLPPNPTSMGAGPDPSWPAEAAKRRKEKERDTAGAAKTKTKAKATGGRRGQVRSQRRAFTSSTTPSTSTANAPGMHGVAAWPQPFWIMPQVPMTPPYTSMALAYQNMALPFPPMTLPGPYMAAPQAYMGPPPSTAPPPPSTAPPPPSTAPPLPPSALPHTTLEVLIDEDFLSAMASIDTLHAMAAPPSGEAGQGDGPDQGNDWGDVPEPDRDWSEWSNFEPMEGSENALASTSQIPDPANSNSLSRMA
ncbi:hypothetical protein HWV62_45224, partial [Athelia sp. TMB]